MHHDSHSGRACQNPVRPTVETDGPPPPRGSIGASFRALLIRISTRRSLSTNISRHGWCWVARAFGRRSIAVQPGRALARRGFQREPTSPPRRLRRRNERLSMPPLQMVVSGLPLTAGPTGWNAIKVYPFASGNATLDIAIDPAHPNHVFIQMTPGKAGQTRARHLPDPALTPIANHTSSGRRYGGPAVY